MKKWLVILLSIVLCLSLSVSAWLTLGVTNKNVTTVTAPDQDSAITPDRFTVTQVEIKRPSGKNLALNQKVQSNGISDIYTPERAVDGKTDAQSYWEGNATLPDNFTVTLDQAQDVGVVLISLNPDPIWQKRTETLSISVSTDGTNFTEEVASKDYQFDPKTGNYVMINFSQPKKIKALQLTFTGNTGAKGAQMAELELYSSAS